MAFIAYEGVAPKGERYDRSSLVNDTENKLYKHTEKGDFIYSSNNLETGSIGLNNYGNACISPVYSIFSCTELSAPDFIGRRLCRKDFINEMVKWRQGVIYGQWRIHEDDFVKIKIAVPTIQEQKKIGQLLLSLDNLITLHQRGANSWVRVRFRRFCSTTIFWEQRRLGEVVPLRGGFAFQSQNFCSTGIPIVKISNILSSGEVGGEFDYYAEQIDDSDYILPDGAAVLAMSGATTGKVAVLNKNNHKFYQNQRVGYFTKTDNADYSFVTTVVRSEKFAEQLKSVLVAGAQPNVSPKDIDSFEFAFPRDTHEQELIGLMFLKLDLLITLHQREFTHTNPNTNYVKYYQRNRPLLCVLRSMDKSV